MTAAARKDPLEWFLTGLPGEWSKAYVRGLLPEGWRLVHGPAAIPDLTGGVVVTAGAERPGGGRQAGARIVVGSERVAAGGNRALLEEVLADLAEMLRAKCVERDAPP